MSRRDVVVPAKLLLSQGIFSWPILKMRNLKFALNRVNYVYKMAFKGVLTQAEKEVIREQIKLEMVVTTVHYAEILASYLLAFEKKGKAVQRSLFNYRIKEVDDFYKDIAKKRESYIARLFSYPQLYQIQPPKVRQKIKKSCAKIKRDLLEIGKYYLAHQDLYNSYKHGMRITSLYGGGGTHNKDYAAIAYFVPDKSFYPAQAVMTRIDHRQAEKLALRIAALLRNATQHYRDRIVEEKTKMTMRLY